MLLPTNYYKVGGSLKYTHPTYVKRKGDRLLIDALRNRDFCYVLNSRQMGKSSLRVRAMKELEKEGLKCASIDVTKIGSHVTQDAWYEGFASELLRGFRLREKVKLNHWWQEHSAATPVQRLGELIEDILLVELSQTLVIFVDEIDSMIKLEFKDDFFAFIRACYNQRVDNQDYERLTFCLLGVATVSDLIQDRERTPFNIGKSIELTGFSLDEAKDVLIPGLKNRVENPEQVLAEVLEWTGGQPFLTQKLCQIIVKNNDSCTPNVGELVQTYIINNWESHDNPEHLRTIRDRILVNEKRASRLLGLYQQVLISSDNGIIANDNLEQMELRLTGLVVKRQDQLQVMNYIYQQVFNLEWVEQELAKLRPYSEAFTAWKKSKYQDESRLLRGQALTDALAWALDKSLSDHDHKFLSASQSADNKAMAEVNKTLEKAKRKAQKLLGISSTVFTLSLVGAVIAGVTVWGANFKVAEVEAVRKSITAKLLSDSDQDFEALRQILRAVKQLPRSNLIFRPKDESKSKIINILRPILNKINEKSYPYRQLKNLDGHENWVNGVAFSPDEKMIASVSRDNTVKLWNLEGHLLQTLEGHQNEVFSVAFSSDGEIASASWDNTVKLWNRQGKLLQTLKGHKDDVYGIAFSPDGEMIASASLDNTVKLWNLQGQLLQTLEEHKYPVNSVAFSPDGKMIASASSDHTVKLWNLQGQLLRTLEGHENLVNGVAFSPDGKMIASASSDHTVKLWNLQGQLLRTLEGHENDIFGVAFSPDGKMIASASSDHTVKLWNLEGQLLQALVGHENLVYGVAFSPDGKMIASASWDNTIKLWNRQRHLLQTLVHQDSTLDVAFSPDGKMIASASWDNTIKLWNLQGQLLQTLEGHDSWVRGIVFSPDGKMIASASDDKTVKLWNHQGKLLQTLEGHDNWVWGIAFSPDGNMIASASRDNTVKLWNLEGKLLQTLKKHEYPVNSVAFSPDGKIIASASRDNTVKLWNLEGKLLQTLVGHENEVNGVAFSPDGKMVASASSDNTVKLWNLQGQFLRTLVGHDNWVWGIAFSPDGKMIASASSDNTVKLWNRQGQLLQTLVGHENKVIGVVFSPDGKMIASASLDNTVRLWNRQGQFFENLIRQENEVNGSAFSPDAEDFDRLHELACDWMRNYLKTNPNVSDSDRHLCDGVGDGKSEVKSK